MNMQATYIVRYSGKQVYEGSRDGAHAKIVEGFRLNASADPSVKVGKVRVERLTVTPLKPAPAPTTPALTPN